MPLNSMFTPSRHLPGKQISDLKLNSCQLHLRLDLAVRVIDDGQEHVEEDEEDDKDVEDEEGGADDRVGGLEGRFVSFVFTAHLVAYCIKQKWFQPTEILKSFSR